MSQQESYQPYARRKAIAPEMNLDEHFGPVQQLPVQPHATDASQQSAEALMDELFSDVEYSLDHTNLLSTEPVKFEAPPQASNTIQQFVLSSYLQNQPQSQPIEPIQPLSPTEDLETLLAPEPKATKPRNGLLDKLLIGVGCASVAATASVWWVTHGGGLNPPSTTAQLPTIGAAGAASTPFTNYLKRSLAAIDRRDPNQQSALRLLPSPNSSPSHSPNNPPNTGTNSSGPGTVIQIPGQPSLNGGVNGGGTTALPPATGLTKLMPIPQLPGANAAAPQAIAGKQAGVTLPPPGPLTPGLIPATPLTAGNPGSPGAPPQTVPLTLVAVLDWGDRSAALIELNGVTQRFRPGDAIGSTGWSLVKVSKNEAVIRRNGEVRSIYTGQQF